MSDCVGESVNDAVGVTVAEELDDFVKDSDVVAVGDDVLLSDDVRVALRELVPLAEAVLDIVNDLVGDTDDDRLMLKLLVNVTLGVVLCVTDHDCVEDEEVDHE